MKSETYNMDCMTFMKECRDKQFDLAIVDPPYGIRELTGKDAAGGHGKLKNRILDRTAKKFNEWDKCQPFPNFSACEFAWTSFNVPAKIFKFDNRTAGKIHPTQKPVELYEWLLRNFAQVGDSILDTHLGSGSSRIAAYEMGFDFTGTEIDTEYFEAQEERFKKHCRQLNLFEFVGGQIEGSFLI